MRKLFFRLRHSNENELTCDFVISLNKKKHYRQWEDEGHTQTNTVAAAVVENKKYITTHKMDAH